MATQQVQQLIRMGNQIARNFAATYGADDAVARTEEHLRRFWSVEMRVALAESVATQHSTMDEELMRAIERLQSRQIA
jgi:hypothetical protein